MCTHSPKYMLKRGIAGHRAHISSNLLDAAKQVSKGIIRIYATYCQVKKVVILVGIEWHLIVVFLYILLMNNKVELSFTCYLAIWISSSLLDYRFHLQEFFQKMCFGFKSFVSYTCYEHHFPFYDLFFHFPQGIFNKHFLFYCGAVDQYLWLVLFLSYLRNLLIRSHKGIN